MIFSVRNVGRGVIETKYCYIQGCRNAEKKHNLCEWHLKKLGSIGKPPRRDILK